MDSIFGRSNFLNEIIWYYKNASRGKQQWAKSHDVIFWYAKEKGRETFNRDEILAPFESGMTEWRYNRGGQKGREAPKGKTPDDVITIPSLNAMAKERTGYPTQKPLALLEQIIKASSNKDDLVLDPFCGCGTAVVAAHNTGRRWAGIDISPFAVESVMKNRFAKNRLQVKTKGIPVDLTGARKLAQSDPFKFEIWAVSQVPGMAPNAKQSGDRGIDGRGTLHEKNKNGKNLVIAQVKAGRPTASQFRDFLHCMDRDNAAAGVFIAMEANDSLRKKAEEQGHYRVPNIAGPFPKVQFWCLEEWLKQNKDRRFLPNLPPMNDPYTGKHLQTATLFNQKTTRRSSAQPTSG